MGFEVRFVVFFIIGLHQTWIKYFIFQFFRGISLQNRGGRILELGIKGGALTRGSRPTPSAGKSANFVGGDDPPPEISVFLFRAPTLGIKNQNAPAHTRLWAFIAGSVLGIIFLCVCANYVSEDLELIPNTNYQSPIQMSSFKSHGRNATNREKSR